MIQILIRFLVGGTVVSIFSLIGSVLKPKSFAGLFGTAPSIALATQGALGDAWRFAFVVCNRLRAVADRIEDIMLVKVDSSELRQSKWTQYAVRFVAGGLITVIAGVVTKRYGPVVGGLLLAFPAIFPASATLIEKAENEKKEKKGLKGTLRGRQTASVDAAGSAMGSMGLLLFAIVVWQFIGGHQPWKVLLGAAAAWLIVSVGVWEIRRRA